MDAVSRATTIAPVRIHVPAWAAILAVVSLFGAYLVLQENGWLVSSWMTLHELFHDGRHALGFPCH
jgi:cobalt transporter subunit CbtB